MQTEAAAEADGLRVVYRRVETSGSDDPPPPPPPPPARTPPPPPSPSVSTDKGTSKESGQFETPPRGAFI